MTAMTSALGEAARLVARATETLSELPSSSYSTSVQSPQATNPTGTNQSNDNSNNQGGGGGGTGGSSPLLFFVALGFGVVFTNLWIIVGVKYCFRYNARNRARMNNEDGEPINLETVQRPHRRRREKKLMSMDEVNDKFPMMKYKTWVLERARDGLPTAGGVTVPASQANSIHEADGIVPVMSNNETPSTDGPRHSDVAVDSARSATPKVETDGNTEKTTTALEDATGAGTAPVSREAVAQGLQRVPSDEDVDEQIDAALPPECLSTPGDTCAICIDSLEDDDDVRGLTCGHAFHAVCLDPWLTSRRACCPLCKADYYTPKPRPNNEGDGAATVNIAVVDSRRGSRVNLPSRLRAAWLRGTNAERPATQMNPRPRRANRTRNVGQGRQGSADMPSPRQQSTPGTGRSFGGGLFSSVRQTLRFGRRNNSPSASENTSENMSEPAASGPVTPSQLEAGNQLPRHMAQ